MTRQFVGYAFRKTLATGFIDMALLLANVSQLKVITEHEAFEPTFKTICTVLLVGASIVLQVIIGCMLIYLGKQENEIISNHPRHVSQDDIADYGSSVSRHNKLDMVDGPRADDDKDAEGNVFEKETKIDMDNNKIGKEGNAYGEDSTGSISDGFSENRQGVHVGNEGSTYGDDQTDSSNKWSVENYQEVHIVLHVDQVQAPGNNANQMAKLTRQTTHVETNNLDGKQCATTIDNKDNDLTNQDTATTSSGNHSLKRLSKYSPCQDGDIQCMNEVHAKFSRQNSFVMGGIFLILVLNVIISGMGIGLKSEGSVVSGEDYAAAVRRLINGTRL